MGKVSRIVANFSSAASIARALDITYALGTRMESFTPRAMEKARGTVDRHAVQPTIAQLRVYPPRRLGMRMRWRSERQRRYVMAMLTATDNLPYKRTGTLRRGWHGEVKVDPRSKGLRIRIWNDAMQPRWKTGEPVRYARFVQGDIGIGLSARSTTRYNLAIQPFHKDRGWQPAAPIIRHGYDRSVQTAMRSVNGSFGAEVQKAMRG